jgi:hypothetical protein
VANQVEDMVVDDEEDKAAHMEEDTPQDEVEEVKNQHDVTLLERFHEGLDLDIRPVHLQIMCLITGGAILIAMTKHWIQEWIIVILTQATEVICNS